MTSRTPAPAPTAPARPRRALLAGLVGAGVGGAYIAANVAAERASDCRATFFGDCLALPLAVGLGGLLVAWLVGGLLLRACGIGHCWLGPVAVFVAAAALGSLLGRLDVPLLGWVVVLGLLTAAWGGACPPRGRGHRPRGKTT